MRRRLPMVTTVNRRDGSRSPTGLVSSANGLGEVGAELHLEAVRWVCRGVYITRRVVDQQVDALASDPSAVPAARTDASEVAGP